MTAIRRARRVDIDIASIYRYSIVHFGLPQAEKYLTGLLRAIDLLQTNPKLGRPVSGRNGTYVLLHRGHKIFYRLDDNGIMIVRIIDARRKYSDHT